MLISEGEGAYQHKLLKGIISECYSLDYDVAIFSTFIKDTGLPEYKIGEKNIYNLINFEHFDGIIVAGLTFAVEKLSEEIEAMLLKKCKCPVLYVDIASRYYPYVCTNDRKAMEQLTDHLIECHGVKDIFLLAANPQSISTGSRIAGFQDSLRRHNIEVDESKIGYESDFYYQGGERFARRIIKGEIQKPEAVMCISDLMAIGMVREFTKHGLHVPEDIIVTGYDGTDEAAFCSTVITTYSAPVMQTGAQAVCELTRLMTERKPVITSVNQGHLEIGRSCGCKDVDYMKRSNFHRLKKKMDDYSLLLDSYMMESLTVEMDFEECIKKFCYYLYLIKDYSDYYLCLCNNWDGSYHNYSSEKEKIPETGYTDKMMLVLASENTKYAGGNTFFSTSDMLPDLWKDRAKPKAYYFTPIHFNDNTIGYSVLTYGEKVKVFDITYRNWSRYIMNVLEFNRTHRQLYRTSFRDVLTGIYNRRGFDLNLPYLMNEAISKRKKLMVIMADLDNLKAVNDKYGHQEGDNIIIAVANAFQSCSRTNEVCARIGGDEFLVAGVDYDESNHIEGYLSSVKEYIVNYNKKSQKPYEILISMGACCDYIGADQDIKEMIDSADRQMYINKASNKKRITTV